jgi:thiosulfate reductase/polysulfide reductase chain A
MSMTNGKPKLSRRQFLQAGGAAMAGAFLLGNLTPAEAAKRMQAVGGGSPEREIYSLCEMCVWRCGLRAKVQDGRVYKLEGNPDHPHSLGKLCPRGQSGLMAAYDPDRILYPLIRAGDRGSGLFRRASWEEALDYVAAKMQQIKQESGPEAMVFSTTHNMAQTQFENLLRAYGSPNYGTQRSLCFNAMITAHLMTYGIEEPDRDYAGAKYIIYAGRNMLQAISNSETQQLVSAIANGTKVVVLDPRYTVTASKATEWYPLRPGTDLAFFLAVLNVIIGEQRYDQAFVEKYTAGFDELKQEVVSYTPEWAAAITGIDAEDIRRVAREFSDVRPHCFAHPNWRTSNFVNSFQAERAVAVLNALMGNWNQPGGYRDVAADTLGLGTVSQPPYPRVTAARLDGVPWKYPVVPPAIGVFQELRDNIITENPYPARGWFVYRQNPVNSLPETQKTLEAISKLEMLVTVDIIMNDTAWFSDVVLPEASYLERYDPIMTVENAAFIRQPVIEPLGESKSALWIFKQLGERLGLGDYFAYQDEEDYLSTQLKPLGVTLEEMKAKGSIAGRPAELPKELSWNTPSGKIEIASETLRKAGHPAVPAWEEPAQPASGQFYLLSGKSTWHTQTATQNNRWLHELYPSNPLWIHPKAAAELGIKSGDKVRVQSEVGSMEIEAWVTEGIRPDCVFAAVGFGKRSKALRTAYAQGANDSDVHQTFTDPVSGGQALSQTFVTVQKV